MVNQLTLTSLLNIGIINNLIGRTKSISLPTAESKKILADKFCDFFVTKLSNIRNDLNDLAVLESTTVPLSCPPVSSLLTPSENVLEHFKPLSVKQVEDITKKYPKTSFELDPIPSKLLVKILPSILPTITDISNKCICSGQFPEY